MSLNCSPVSFALRALRTSLVAIGLGAMAPVAMAQIETFMFIDGIPGESVVVDKKDWIALTGYSQTFGTKDCSRAVARKNIDRASPLLIQRAASNQLIPTVIITMRKAGEVQRDFFRATLDLVLVDRIELADQDSQLVERVVLAPRTIKIEYFPQDAKGTIGAPIVTTVSCSQSRGP